MLLESLKHGETPEALQDLSMILRQIRVKGEDPVIPIDESIRLAKKAITMNMNDHKSWYVLGNAHYMRFFAASQDVGDLKKALVAYTRSEALGGDCNPDLFFNRGNVFRYLQDYSAAQLSYGRAIDIDPSFTDSQEAAESVTAFVNRANEMVNKRGWFQKKRLDKIIQQLSVSRHIQGCTGLRTLQVGANVGVTLAVCVLMPATTGNIPPECFLCVDADGICAIVSIYNIGHDAPPPSPNIVMTIRDPVVSDTSLDMTDIHSTTASSNSPTGPTGESASLKDVEADDSSPPLASVGDEVRPRVLLVQAFSLDNVKVDGRALNRGAVAPPQLVVNISDS